jgi:hypothetical protein
VSFSQAAHFANDGGLAFSNPKQNHRVQIAA